MEKHYTDKEELLMEMEDVVGKLQDCIETVKSDKELDSTQEAFLRMHKVSE